MLVYIGVTRSPSEWRKAKVAKGSRRAHFQVASVNPSAAGPNGAGPPIPDARRLRPLRTPRKPR